MQKKVDKLLRPNMIWFFAFMLIVPVAAFLMDQYLLLAISLVAAALAFGVYLYSQNVRKTKLEKYIRKNVDRLNGVQGGQWPFPMLVVRMDDEAIVLSNDFFVQLTGFREAMKERYISDLLPGFNLNWLNAGKSEYPYDVTLEGRRYRVYGTLLQADDSKGTRLGVLYLADLTELYQVRDEYIRSRPVVSIIMVDNYEELTKNLTESAISTLNAKLNEVITQWCERYHGLLRRLERNRFLFIFEKRDLKQAMDEKFTILEEVHQITNPSGLAASISFGLGVDAATFEEGFEFAALSIEMALSRGGDQAVVKDRVNFDFFGGRSKEAEHRSKVRSRVTANSLMELIGQSSRVFIMGHKFADLDAVGAAMGVACLCRKKNKEFHIIIDKEHNAAKKLIEEIEQEPRYKNRFISPQDAQVLSDNRSTLIVVDTNRPAQLEEPNLLQAIPRVCVIDHHRRAEEYIKAVVVELHETSASSASELVTELLQYAVEKKDVLPIEAKSLMAGLVLDTKSFNVRTGERTFEAAAYLRQLGADTVDVKMLLRTDFDETMTKFEIMRLAQPHPRQKDVVIAVLKRPTSRPVAAQAADELLNIDGVTASFVMYPENGQVNVSARSIGAVNVQMILEPLQGGGNAATAGAQVKNTSLEEVCRQIVANIDEFYKK